jgi:hypothetical protein
MKSTVSQHKNPSNPAVSASGDYHFKEKVEKAKKRFEEAGFTPAFFQELEAAYDRQPPAKPTARELLQMDEIYITELLTLVEQQMLEIKQLKNEVKKQARTIRSLRQKIDAEKAA